MNIERFYDDNLSQASYVILSDSEIAIIDPARDPAPYYQFAKKHNAKIVAVIETHTHADFVSGHLEIHKTTGATIYTSKLVNPLYEYSAYDNGDTVKIGKVTLKALNTPGHSSDSICVLLQDEKGKDYAVFTGDTLFVGDVGRPDLREDSSNASNMREELAKALYTSTRNVLLKLSDDVKVFPAHGAGSLCGKNISSELSSTIGKEKQENYALQPMPEDQFVNIILEGQPFIPKYFQYNVARNKIGAPYFEPSIQEVPRLNKYAELDEKFLIVDTRPQELFKAGHIPGAINIMDGKSFETWLGTVVGPEEEFYLVGKNNETLERLIRRVAKIGYEGNIKGALLHRKQVEVKSPVIDISEFSNNPESFEIIDVRNPSELKEGKIFDNAAHIPLPELGERIQEVKTKKPVVVHCAAGYRSAIGASLLEKYIPNATIYDLSEAIKDFKTNKVETDK